MGQDWASTFGSADGNAVYDEVLVPRLFEPWANLLLDELATAPGERLLDVATGPGTVARLAAARLGPAGGVTGCDLNAAMLDIARAKPAIGGAAPITYLACPAGALAVPDGGYDAVTCQQGVQFFPDRVAALAEMRRAARPGGRIGVAVWARVEEVPPFARLADAVERVLGPAAAARYRSGPWGFPYAEELAAVAAAAGLAEVTVTTRRLPLVFEGGPAQFARVLATSSVAADVAALDETGRARLAEAAADTLAPLVDGAGAIRSYATSNLLLARA